MMNFKEAAAFITVKRETAELEAKLKEDRAEAIRTGERYFEAVYDFKLSMLREFKQSLMAQCPHHNGVVIATEDEKDGHKFNVCIICQNQFADRVDFLTDYQSTLEVESEVETPNIFVTQLGNIIIELAESYDEMPEEEAIELIISTYNEKYNNKKGQERTRKK